MRIEVQRLDPGLPLPGYAREGDAGLDLYAAETLTLAPGARAAVGTGIAVAIPAGCAGFVLPRSGLALRHGVTVLNAPGLIDAGVIPDAVFASPELPRSGRSRKVDRPAIIRMISGETRRTSGETR